jgi:hypothetical protein
LGFGPANNALEYVGSSGDPFANNRGNYGDRNRNYDRAEARGLGMPERNGGFGNPDRAEARGLGAPSYIDDSRRGVYVDRNSRAPNAPVRMNRDAGNDL